MGRKAGALLWNRTTVTFPPNVGTVDVDTGLTQPNRSFDAYSPSEPGLDTDVTIGSRVQVVPLSPIANWAGKIHGEPFFNPTTGTVHVVISIGLIPEPPFQIAPVNVLFWDPHSIVGPGDADTYNP